MRATAARRFCARFTCMPAVDGRARTRHVICMRRGGPVAAAVAKLNYDARAEKTVTATMVKKKKKKKKNK